uniref:Magnesium transporter n=1 Tax=Prolemur simus TaxID=1328070 RepID=A0A8C8ZFA7_PROSS
MECLRSLPWLLSRTTRLPRRTVCALALDLTSPARPVAAGGRAADLLGRSPAVPLRGPHRLRVAGEIHRFRTNDVSQATLASVSPVFTVVSMITYRKCFPYLKQWLFRELPSQLSGEGQLVTYPLPFEFRAIEALLQYWISTLQGKLSTLQPLILETLEALVDPKHSSVDRSKLHILLQNGKSLSELETDIKIFKESILEILDEEELLEELCLSKWSDPQVFEKSSTGIDHAEEMELLLENYYRLAEDLSNAARELRVLIDDSQSIIFINLDSHRNVMMRLNLQLTMGTFSLSLFGLMGVAFGMNLESSLEEDHRVFWLITGIMFMGSGLIWRRLLSFLGRQLAPWPPVMASLPKKTLLGDRSMELKNSLRPDGLGSSRSILTNR